MEHHVGKEPLKAEGINTTGVPVYSAWSDRESSSLCTQNWYHMMAPVTHSYIWNRYAAKTLFASLTKIERQEIILSIEYSIIFIAVFVDKLQNQESCMHKNL